MARPSKLTEKQWAELQRRLVEGEKASDLSREYGVSKAVISARFSKSSETVKEVARQIVETEQKFSALTISEQTIAVNLAHTLREISGHMAKAAAYGAMTAHRLMGVAQQQSESIDDADPSSPDSLKALQSIRALAVTANDASLIGRDLLKANKDAIDDLNKQADKPEPKQIVFTVADASA